MQLSAATTAVSTEVFSDLLRRKYGDFRSAAKQLARAAGTNETAARNWLQGRNRPGFDAMIELMRADDDVFDLVCRLADRDPQTKPLTDAQRIVLAQLLEGCP